MEINTAITEVSKVLDAFSWFDQFNNTNDDTKASFKKFILVDFSIINDICNNADDKLDKTKEMIFTILIYGVMLGKQRVNDWFNMPEPLKEKTNLLIKSYLRSIEDFKNEVIKKNDGLLNSIVTKGLDKETNTNLYFDKTAHAMYRFAQILTKADGTVSEKEEEALKHIYKLIYGEMMPDKANITLESLTVPDESLEQAICELNGLIGMSNIKGEVQTLINFLKVQKVRMDKGMLRTPISLHAVFCGPPGTGKTSVARLLGKIYKNLGFLSKGHLIETDRAGLVAGYVGQTALKVAEVVDSALDGILFIDEAYALKPESGGADYGQEAIDILLKRMEDSRDRLVVIVAGYSDEMKRFVESNPGFKSRFNRYFYFDHYTPDELLAISEKFCKGGDFVLTETAKEKLKANLEILYASRDRTFGNGRLVRNIFEKIVERQSNRIAHIAPLTDEILTTITEEDIPPA